MQTTEITTAARRITRTLNAAPRDTQVTFDPTTGHELGRVHGVETFAAEGGIVLTARVAEEDRSQRRWTHLDAQAVLDEFAAGVR